MLVNRASLNDLFNGFNARFNQGFQGAQTYHAQVATAAPSTGADETYGWLGQMPRIREWVGDRVVKSLVLHGYAIPNRRYENTVSVPRVDVEDDRYGVFGPMFEEMGRVTAEHPDELLFGLLASGAAVPCYDGQYFFDTDHPVGTNGGDYPVRSVSNLAAGAGPAWYLLACSRAVRPLIWQVRTAYRFTALDRDEDENVFWRDEFVYGVRARAAAGFGLWQLAYASKAELNADNYAAARQAMRELRGDEGRPLGVRPTHLVAPPSLEKDGMALLNAQNNAAGGSNVWAGSAELVVTEYLAA